jgi:lipopolysaccharide/colanic/teichoic acid biosynthesis glycosyltransferase
MQINMDSQENGLGNMFEQAIGGTRHLGEAALPHSGRHGEPARLHQNGLPAWKRALDLTLVALMSPGLLLVGGFVALVIKLGSQGPLFFRQQRVGYRGREFTIYKFRTMRANAETESHRRHTAHLIKSQDPMKKLDERRDPRVIPGGAWLRAGGLDELPQVINVLRGEMSLIGPRPCIPYEYQLYEPWHRGRLDATPGLTGLWQVSGKNRTTFDEMVRLDIEYAQKRSLALDLSIILRTVPALWRQYCDLRASRRQSAERSVGPLGKSAESYHL